MKDFRVASFILTCFLLYGLVCRCESQVVITRQPENTTACRGSEVIITCGHNSITPLFDTIWSINGSDFRSIKDDPLYRANNQTLIIVSIDYTTTFRCSVQILQSQPPIVLTSTIGTVIVVDRPVVEITAATAVCGYVNVSWTATGNNDECSPVQYNVTLSSSTMDMTVSITSMNTHSFTELSNNTQFNVTVIGINVMGVVSDPASTSVDIHRPVVEITAATAGCGYISVSWTATGNSDVCSPVQYNVTLSSSTMSMTVSITSMNTHNFTELPDDTQFTVTVIGINMMGVVSDPVSTSVVTNCGVGGGGGKRDGSTDSNSDDSSTGVIVGGVIGGIIAVVVIVVLITVVCYFVINRRKKDSSYDDTANLKSPTGTSGSHASAGETNGTSVINTQYDDKVEYAAPAQTVTIPHQMSANGQEYAVSTKAVTIPHQTSTNGQEYAVSTKAVTIPHQTSTSGQEYAVSTKSTKKKTSQTQPPVEQYDDVEGTKKNTQGIQYADLQMLPTEPTRKDFAAQDPVVTYSQIA